MPRFSWIQLAGLGQISAERWPACRDALLDDLARLRVVAPPPQMVVCFGPLTSDADDAGFAILSQRLADLAPAFAEAPAILALPADDDLTRVSASDPHRVALSQWHDLPQLADQWFWDEDSEYLAAVHRWLAAYTRWSASALSASPDSWTLHTGLLPGDAAWRRTFDGAAVGLLALTTSFLNPALSGPGVVHPRQLHAPCGGDLSAWLADCSVGFLVTTHTPRALHPSSLAVLQQLAPPGRFAAHLCGPGDFSRLESIDGSPLRLSLSVPMLLDADARGGYLVGVVDLGDTTLRIWPRALRLDRHGPRCTPDVDRWSLDTDGGTQPFVLPGRRPGAPQNHTKDLRDALRRNDVRVDPAALVHGTVATDGQTLDLLTSLPPPSDLWITGAPPLDLLPLLPEFPGVRRWIAGASLAELIDKLCSADPPIHAWDGAPLPIGAILSRSLRLSGDRSPHLDNLGTTAPSDDLPLLDMRSPRAGERRSANPLWSALVSAARRSTRDRARGVLVVAAPGAGKSVWSQQLARAFRDGPYGALGSATWRPARELAETMRTMPGRAWPEWLAHHEPGRAPAFTTLAQTHRLVVVVDGLDELTPAELAAMEAALRRVPGLWVATRRPDETATAPRDGDFVRLELVGLADDDRRRLLASLGREDLARDPHRSTRSILNDDPTPLILSLTARIVAQGEDPEALSHDELYRRFFDLLLLQAQRDRRLDVEGSRLLQLLLGSVVGTLALLWLEDGARPLDATRIEVVLEQVGLPPHARVAALHALEFGYLLRPVAGGWEFAHRTLAEWAAAAALRRRVEHLRLQSPHGFGERDTLAPFLDTPGPRAFSRWAQLLRFYGPHVSDPVGLVTALIGPDGAAHWCRPFDLELDSPRPPDEHAVHHFFHGDLEFAVELLARCRWATRAAAQRTWALVARAWLLLRPPEHVRDVPRAFLDGLAPHLPATLAGLVDLFAADADARTRLIADPTPLLPTLPPARSDLLDDYLVAAPSDGQYRVLEWANRNNAVLPTRWLRASTFEQPHLEAAAWHALIRLGDEPPWSALRRAAYTWPYHLESAILAWTSLPSPQRLGDDAIDRRRVILGIVLDRCCAARTELDDLVASLDPPRLARVGAAVLARNADRDGPTSDLLLYELLRERGVERPSQREANPPDPAVAVLDRHLTVAQLWHDRLCKLLRALAADLDAIAGTLWRSLLPDAPARRRLAAALNATRRWPAAVDLASILAAQGRHASLRTTLAPEHVVALRDYADEQIGAARVTAVLQLADVEDIPPAVALLAAYRPGDDAYESAAREHLERHPPPKHPVPLRDEILVRLPFNYQAALSAPGWRERLLAAIAGPDGSNAACVRVATEFTVTEALVPLLERLEHTDRAPCNLDLATVLDAIAALCPADDRALGARALHAALARATDRLWLRDPVALARFLQVEHLPRLLATIPTELQRPAVRERLRSLGPPAFDHLLAALHAETDPTRRRTLGDTLIEIADPRHISLPIVLDLCADMGADQYTLSGIPGPLGAEFDEPEDLEWHTELTRAPTLTAIGKLLRACMQARPDLWPELEPLLDHPSALLRGEAFARILEHAPWDPTRVMTMLYRLLTAPATAVDGDRRALTLIAAGRVEHTGATIRDAWSEALRHLEGRLGFQHEDLLVLLISAVAPRLRAQGATWIGKFGSPAWIDHVLPLLADQSPTVVTAALRAILQLDAARAPAAIATARRDVWTHHHYLEVLGQILRSSSVLDQFRGTSRNKLRIPADLAWTLLDEAVAVQPPAVARRGPTLFDDFPSTCEELLADRELFDAARIEPWTAAPDATVRAVARRLLAARHAIPVAVVLPSLTADNPADRLSAAECLTRMNCTEHAPTIAAVWHACVALRRNHNLASDIQDALWQLERRLLWALLDRPAAIWVPLLELALHDLPQDHEDMSLTADGQRLLSHGCDLLERLDGAGLCAFIRAMDHHRIDVDPAFSHTILARVQDDPALLVEIQRLADQGSTSAGGIFAQATRVLVDPREALAERLRCEVFVEPASSPTALVC